MTVMGKTTRRGHDALGRDALSANVDIAHGAPNHTGIGQAEKFGDRPIGGDAAAGYVANHLMDHVDDGSCLPFSGRSDSDKAFLACGSLLFWRGHLRS